MTRHHADGMEVRGPAIGSLALRLTRVVGALLRLGVPMGPLRLLETTGRRSGVPRTTPVALTAHAGRTWLVSPFGETHWVHNVRARPTVHLVRGRRRPQVRLTEVDDDTAAPVLRAFRRGYRAVPFVRPAFAAGSRAGVAAFRAEAHRHPVFRVDPV